MIKILKFLKKYYKIAKVKSFFIFFEFVFLMIPSIVSIISPFLLANAISSITVFDFKNAINNTLIDFVLIVVSCLSYHFFNIFEKKVNKIIIINFQTKILDTIETNKSKNFDQSMVENVWSIADFNTHLLYKICFLIKSITILIIIAYYNIYISLILFCVSIVSVLLLQITKHKIQFYDKRFSDIQITENNLFNSIKNYENFENDSLKTNVKEKYFSNIESSIKTKNKLSLFYDLNNNFISLILKATVFVLTIYLINLVKSTNLTLSNFLIITPYLTSSATNLISFFEIFSVIGKVQNIMLDYEIPEIKKNETLKENFEFESFDLSFYNIKINYKNCIFLQDFSKKFMFKTKNCIYSNNSTILNKIFNSLNYKKEIDFGGVFLGEKNIREIENKYIESLIFFTGEFPKFLNLSVLDNLKLICPNENFIKNEIKKINMKKTFKQINFNSSIEKIDNHSFKFFLGLSRCLLNDSKIVVVNEIPGDVILYYFDYFKFLIDYISSKKTILIFSTKIKNNTVFDNYINIDALKNNN